MSVPIELTNIEYKVESFLEEQFLINFDDKTTKNSDLFQQGHIDSYGFMELIGFLEKEFKIKIQTDELISESLNSLSGMVEFVQTKLSR